MGCGNDAFENCAGDGDCADDAPPLAWGVGVGSDVFA